ncbi:MAG: hypothetical protein IMZ44_12690 [Planctomycetes bacterium]|nr:hypothetical protein [Planctomycetota bacterium]
MQLETHKGILSNSPTDEQIRDALAAVNASENEDSFAALARSDKPEAYMAASGGPKSFCVQFHEQGKDYLAEGDVPYELAALLMTSYNRGDDAWRTKVPWQKGGSARPGETWVKALLVVVLILLAIAAVLLYRTIW